MSAFPGAKYHPVCDLSTTEKPPRNAILTEGITCGILSHMSTDQMTHTTLDLVTVVPEALANLPVVTPEVQEAVAMAYPPLTRDEETFCLAIVECSGNISAAYKMTFGDGVSMPLARGKQLLTMPAVALKIRDITDKVQEASLISVGAHLDQMAKIRDLSITTGQLKVAYMAERARAEAVGIYQKHDVHKGKGGGNNVQINVTMASQHDVSI